MNNTKTFLSIAVGALFMGSMLSIASYLINEYIPTRGGSFLSLRELGVILAIIFGIVFGGIIGGVSGFFIESFQLRLVEAILFGLLSNIFISIFLILWLGDDPFYERQFGYFLIALIILGTLNGAIVSVTGDRQKSPEINLKRFSEN